MLQGAWTAQAARKLSARFDSLGFDVLCARQDRRVRKDESSQVMLGQIISWIGPEFKPASFLAFPDIAIVDRASKKVILLAEVEESKAQPKVVIADLFATLLGDHITFGRDHKEELKIGPWTTFSVLTKSTGKGSGVQQLQSLARRLDEARKRLPTPNASVGQISIETYRSESELGNRLIAQTEKALRAFGGKISCEFTTLTSCALMELERKKLSESGLGPRSEPNPTCKGGEGDFV